MRRLRFATLLLATAALAGCGGGSGESTESASPPPGEPAGLPARLFAPDAVWNAKPAEDAQLDPDSEALSSALASQAETVGSMINTIRYSTPVYTVGADQADVPVQIDGADGALRRAVSAVPLPADARPATGTDKHLVVWQPATDTMWEFWRLRRKSDGWHAGYGGRIAGVQQSPGYYRNRRLPTGEIVEQADWGATATGLPLAGGLITIAELRAGKIDHALALGVPRVEAGTLAFPAQRSDGRDSGPGAIPEGARFRLDPRLDIGSLGLPPALRAIAVAAQRYGMIVRDGSSAVSLYAEDPTPTGSDPYRALFSGLRPYKLAALFPWDRLQLLKMQLRQERQ
jgi:hypothetical protein